MNKENLQKLHVLIKDVQDGNEDAFRVIFDRLSARLFAYVLSHTSHRDDALDIVQETFIDVWKGLPTFQYKSDEQFYGFVFVVLKRKIYKRHRSMRDTVSLDEEILHESYEMKTEDYRHLLKHVGKLGESYQDILKLRYWSGMTFTEAAAMLGIKETTAKVWHHRAIKKLQAMLEKEQYEN
ncbi:MAG: RNA polymerase sigma factor [Candidatus Yonathbacteria bacterium]|nr:RNA polymerase sigma factor [Candidatus Yonathbacteria bacterium]